MRNLTHTLALSIVVLVAGAAGQDVPLLNGSIAVNTSSYVTIPFYVEGSMATVTGRFTAQGSINAYILDSDGFTNFRGGAQAPTYYNSGNIIVANINVTLSQGSYVLVFQNNNILSNKTVFGNITLKSARRKALIECAVRKGGATVIRIEDGEKILLSEGASLLLVKRSAKYSIVETISYRATVLTSRIYCRK